MAQNVNSRFHLVHFNHEGLHPVARWLRPRVQVPFTMHIRTNLIDTMFARQQMGIISRNLDHLVFITENERKNFTALGGKPKGSDVIHNIVGDGSDVAPYPDLLSERRFKVLCLGNYAWVRGIDRLIDIAAALRSHGRNDVLFVVAGNTSLSGSLPGNLKPLARAGGNLADFAAAKGVSEFFRFLDHVDQPESVVRACDVLINPSREDNPWGRVVLEALAGGKPVIAPGRYDRFVEDGVTGLLFERFDTDEFAGAIAHLADDRALCRRLGAAGRERVLSLCDGPARAADLLNIWTNVRRH